MFHLPRTPGLDTGVSNHTAYMPLLKSAEVAEQLRVSQATLSRWRVFKSGPKFVNVGGMPRYRQSDIDAYIEDNIQ
jgi:predicted DNA-binding transcriptional regulator AlpA